MFLESLSVHFARVHVTVEQMDANYNDLYETAHKFPSQNSTRREIKKLRSLNIDDFNEIYRNQKPVVITGASFT